MLYRQSLIFPAEDLGSAGTKIIAVDTDKPISRLEFTFKTTKVLSAMTAPGPANIPKIELVEGSKLLHSLSGYENQALAYYSRGKVAMEHGQHIAALSEVDIYALDFGRYLWDPMLAFDPKRHKNPELKITWDENLADTSAEVNYLEIWAYLFDEKPVSPIGFLSAIEHHSYTPGSSGSYENILLPDDRVIRQILLRAHYDGYEPWYNIAEARLDENTLDRIPFDFTDLEMYYRRMKSIWPRLEIPFQAGIYTSDRIFYIPASDYWATVNLTSISSGALPFIVGTSAKGGKATLQSSVDRQHIGTSSGYLPWSCFQFPMGNQQDIADWYNPVGKKPRLRLRAYTGATYVDAQVVLEQVYKY